MEADTFRFQPQLAHSWVCIQRGRACVWSRAVHNIFRLREVLSSVAQSPKTANCVSGSLTHSDPRSKDLSEQRTVTHPPRQDTILTGLWGTVTWFESSAVRLTEFGSFVMNSVVLCWQVLFFCCCCFDDCSAELSLFSFWDSSWLRWLRLIFDSCQSLYRCKHQYKVLFKTFIVSSLFCLL